MKKFSIKKPNLIAIVGSFLPVWLFSRFDAIWAIFLHESEIQVQVSLSSRRFATRLHRFATHEESLGPGYPFRYSKTITNNPQVA